MDVGRKKSRNSPFSDIEKLRSVVLTQITDRIWDDEREEGSSASTVAHYHSKAHKPRLQSQGASSVKRVQIPVFRIIGSDSFLDSGLIPRSRYGSKCVTYARTGKGCVQTSSRFMCWSWIEISSAFRITVKLNSVGTSLMNNFLICMCQRYLNFT